MPSVRDMAKALVPMQAAKVRAVGEKLDEGLDGLKESGRKIDTVPVKSFRLLSRSGEGVHTAL